MKDDPLLSAARRALDDSLHTLDARRLSRLDQARQHALQRLGRRRGGSVRGGVLSLPLAMRWLPGGLALASVAVLTIALQQPATPPAPPEVVEDGFFEVLAIQDDQELLRDLDFYEWLALQQHAS